MRAAPSRRRGRTDVMGIARPRRRLPPPPPRRRTPPPPRRRRFSGGFLGDEDVAVKGKYHALDFFLLFFPSSLQLGAATALTGCAAGGRGGIHSWGSRYVGGQTSLDSALSLPSSGHPEDKTHYGVAGYGSHLRGRGAARRVRWIRSARLSSRRGQGAAVQGCPPGLAPLRWRRERDAGTARDCAS